jgi:hypothetical protein
MFRRRHVVLLLAAASAVVAPVEATVLVPAAHAAEARRPPLTPAQREGEKKALAAFAAGRYQESVEIYAGLWADYRDPIYMRNIGRCYQRLGNAERAIASFEEYLARARQLGPTERQEIEGYLAGLRAARQKQDEEARARAEASREKAMSPPAASPAALAAVPAAAPTPVWAGKTALPAPGVDASSRPPADGGGRLWRGVGVGALVLAAGLAAGGGALLWSSWSRFSSADGSCSTPPASCEAAADTIQSRNTISRVLFGAAALTAVTGGALIYFHPVHADAGSGGSHGFLVGAARTF